MKKVFMYTAILAVSVTIYACKNEGGSNEPPAQEAKGKLVATTDTMCTDCDDPACLEEYVIKHTISQGWLDTVAIKDGNGTKLPPKQVTADYIRGAVESLNCNEFVFCCIDSSATITSNNQILFQIRSKPDNELVEVYYQIQLLKGLLLQHQPDAFRFYNGVKENNKKDIVFEVVKDNVVVHCADLSNDF